MVLDTALLNTQQYKVRTKSKVEQSRQRRSTAPPPCLGVVTSEKGAFRSPTTTVANFTFTYGISTTVGYLMPNPVYSYILNIYDLVWLGLWHIYHCRSFNDKSSLYIYIKYIWFSLVVFYGISTIVGYLMTNPVYTYILNIYNLVGLGFMAYQTL